MAANVHNNEAVFGPIPIVQSDSTVYDPNPLRGLYVFADGTVKIKNGNLDTVTLTFPAAAAGGSFPAYILGPIKMVFATDTSVADANLIGLR